MIQYFYTFQNDHMIVMTHHSPLGCEMSCLPTLQNTHLSGSQELQGPAACPPRLRLPRSTPEFPMLLLAQKGTLEHRLPMCRPGPCTVLFSLEVLTAQLGNRAVNESGNFP